MNLKEKVKITTDSCVDLEPQILRENNIDVAYLSIVDGNTNMVYRDGDLSNEDLYERFDQGHKIKTSSPSYGEYLELFKKNLQKYERIVHYNISSSLSSSYQTAYQASKELDEQRITVIDTHHATMGMAINVLNAVNYLNEIADFNEFLETTKSDLSRTEFHVVLNTAKYVFLGGRLQNMFGKTIGGALDKMAGSSIDYLGERLKLKYFVAIEDGRVKMKKWDRGKTVNLATRYFKEIMDNTSIDTQRIMLGTTGDINNLDKIYHEIPQMAEVDQMNYANVGSVIATHCGPQALALSFIKKR